MHYTRDSKRSKLATNIPQLYVSNISKTLLEGSLREFLYSYSEEIFFLLFHYKFLSVASSFDL